MIDGISIPILPARDLFETRSFYARLGFDVGYWAPHPDEGYAILTRGDLRMHFVASAAIVPTENDAGCYWQVNDADALYRECQALGLPAIGTPCLLPMANKPWGMREFALVDPSGNLVRIGHHLNAAG